MKTQEIISWILRIIIAIIFLQTLYFKFTAHPDSVYIFSQLDLEPYGRIGLGIIELVTSVFILIPRTKILGILISFGIILGAIFSHFIVLGTNVKGDGGTLFFLALTILFCTLILIFINFSEILLFFKNFKNKILR